MTRIRNNQGIHCWPVHAREIAFEDGEPFQSLRVIQTDGRAARSSPVWVGP